MHGRSRNAGIFQYFDTFGNPLKNRHFNVSQGRLSPLATGRSACRAGLLPFGHCDTGAVSSPFAEMGRVAKKPLLTVGELWHIRVHRGARERENWRDERDCQVASRARRASETHAVPLRIRRAPCRIGNPTMWCTGRDVAALSAAMWATANMSKSCSPIVSTGCGLANSGEPRKARWPSLRSQP